MIRIDLEKARAIAHEKRRRLRSAEFLPLDQLIAAQIPGTDFPEIEARRQMIRDKYDLAQNQINAAIDLGQIKSVLLTLEL